MATEDHVWWYQIMACPETSVECYDSWTTIHITALIPAIFSILASIFIIVCGIHYHNKLLNLSFAAKLPIFISICDLLFEVCHGSDHIYSIAHDYVAEGVLCQFLGSMKPFTVNCQTMWTLAIAVYLNRTVFNDSMSKITFGPHNIYLHLCCWGIPTIILIFGFIFDVYGVEGPWCGIPNPNTDFWMVDVWMIITLLILVINYSYIIYKLYKVINYDKSQKNANQKIKKVIRTIGLYPIAYFMQWFAAVLFKTHVIEPTFNVLLWVVSSANLGGIFNLCLYGPLLFNQIKRVKETNEKMMAAQVNKKQDTEIKSNTSNACTSMASTTNISDIQMSATPIDESNIPNPSEAQIKYT